MQLMGFYQNKRKSTCATRTSPRLMHQVVCFELRCLIYHSDYDVNVLY